MSIQRKNQNASNSEPTIGEADVISYLKSHPDFFRENTGVLGDMSLPHTSGNAVSLVERQVAVLRERSMSTRRKLGELLDNAKENDELFFKTQSLILKLIKAANPQDLFDTISREFKARFDVQYCAIFMIANDQNQSAEFAVRSLENVPPSVNNILESHKTFCGPLRAEESLFFFNLEHSPDAPASAAIAVKPTTQGKLVLAIAHDDGNHYTSNTGTIFIDYIAEVTQTLLDK